MLQRLAKQAVDRERQALLTIGAEIAEVEARIANRRRAIEREAAAPLDFMTSGATLPAFLAAAKTEIETLRARLVELQQTYDAQLERVRQERTEQKRYQTLAERRAKRDAQALAAKEQKAIDELVIMRRRED